MELNTDDGFISMSAEILELYREYASAELKDGKEDFMTYSEWKEENKEVLS